MRPCGAAHTPPRTHSRDHVPCQRLMQKGRGRRHGSSPSASSAIRSWTVMRPVKCCMWTLLQGGSTALGPRVHRRDRQSLAALVVTVARPFLLPRLSLPALRGLAMRLRRHLRHRGRNSHSSKARAARNHLSSSSTTAGHRRVTTPLLSPLSLRRRPGSTTWCTPWPVTPFPRL